LRPPGAARIDRDGVARLHAALLEPVACTTGAGDPCWRTGAAELRPGRALGEASPVAGVARSVAPPGGRSAPAYGPGPERRAPASYATEQDVRGLAAEQDNRS